ncbi:MAG: tetratricopeptide repeat protein [Bacteroidia bacterium]|nr:tetratricopeptide repeat protein [Bacteroidia bacterium]
MDQLILREGEINCNPIEFKIFFRIKNRKQQRKLLLYTLAYLYSSNRKFEKAKNVMIRLVELFPDNPQYLSMLQQLSSQS